MSRNRLIELFVDVTQPTDNELCDARLSSWIRINHSINVCIYIKETTAANEPAPINFDLTNFKSKTT